MAKKEENQEKGIAVIQPRLAQIVESEIKENSNVAIPEGFESGKEVSSFAPVVNFENPGEFVTGYFKGMKDSVGPNASKLYLIELPKGKEIVAVWGCTVLDSKILTSGIRIDDKVLIQRLEDIPAKKKGQSPAKNFRVLIGS